MGKQTAKEGDNFHAVHLQANDENIAVDAGELDSGEYALLTSTGTAVQDWKRHTLKDGAAICML